MARLNIYIPDDLHRLAEKWRGTLKLSDTCARALRAEIDSAESLRSPKALLARFHGSDPMERQLSHAFGLRECVVTETPPDETEIRETLGKSAAEYLDRWLCDGSRLMVTGGRQTWCVVRNMAPRNLRVAISALGVRQNDPNILHAHPNTLVTLLWLLYSPRAEARLVGATIDLPAPREESTTGEYPRHFLIGSCDQFHPDSPFARLIGEDATRQLVKSRALGDFAYCFVSEAGDPVEPAMPADSTLLSPRKLISLSQRSDARIILVAGGKAKLKVIRLVLHAGLCNVLITDTATAEQLLQTKEGRNGNGELGPERPLSSGSRSGRKGAPKGRPSRRRIPGSMERSR